MATTSKSSGKSTSKSSRTQSNGTAKKSSSKSSSKKSAESSRNGVNNEDAGKEQLMKLFEHGLKDMYWAEKALTRAIPKMMKKAISEELQTALEDHLEVTEGQVEKLEKVFKGIDKAPRAKKCMGMTGIIEEGEEIMSEFDSEVIDAAIISAAQKVEHYEMSSYMSMITLARTLDLVKEAELLQEILDEEMEADKTLMNIGIRLAHETAVG